MSEFFSDLRNVLGLGVLKRVGRKTLDDDCLGLAGQLGYFTLFSLFPFLSSLVALAGLAVDDPVSILETLTERLQGFLPKDAVGLLSSYIDLTLRGATLSVLFLGILATLWSGWAAASAIIKATNRAYELQETRALWKLMGISALMILGFYPGDRKFNSRCVRPRAGRLCPRVNRAAWRFPNSLEYVTVGVSLSGCDLCPRHPLLPGSKRQDTFKWITPGGFTATVLILISSVLLNVYVTNLGHYNQIYGQVGAIIVLMLWLYVTELMVLVGAEMNAALTRMAEERKDTKIVEQESTADQSDTWLNNGSNLQP